MSDKTKSDQTPHSDLGLHCLPVTLLEVSRQQRLSRYGVDTCRGDTNEYQQHMVWDRN